MRSGEINGSVAQVTALNHYSVSARILATNNVLLVSFSSQKTKMKLGGSLSICRIREISLEQASFGTIHRCQGLRLDRVIIDVRIPHFSHVMFYMGISRVRTLDSLQFWGSLSTLVYYFDPSMADEDALILDPPSARLHYTLSC